MFLMTDTSWIKCGKPASGQHSWSYTTYTVVEILVATRHHHNSLLSPYGNQEILKSLVTKIGARCRWEWVKVEEMEGTPSGAKNAVIVIFITVRYLLIRRLLEADTRQQVSMRVAHKRLNTTRGREQIGCLPGIGMFKETQAEERGEIMLNLQRNRNLT